MAHVVLAAAAIDQLDLAELIVTVAGVPWQKVGSRTISGNDERLRMCETVFAEVEGATVSDLEMRREGNSYTIDTLEHFADEDVELFLILGSDTAAGLDTWERYEEIADLATIAVFERRGYEDARPPASFSWIEVDLPGLEISSTDIRNRASQGRPIVGLVPPAVRETIESEKLYFGAQHSESQHSESQHKSADR